MRGLFAMVFLLNILAGLVSSSQATDNEDAEPSAARVAILVEPELANVGGQLSLMAGKIEMIMARRGIVAAEMSADQMADPNFFNTDRFSVAVLAYGNAFPLIGYENLRRFHRQGGCLVLNGIPFCHPNKREGDKWIDTADRRYLEHNDFGMGTGGFLNPAGETHGQRLVKDNPLQLPADILPRTHEWLQYLNRRSFPEQDVILPLVETKTVTSVWQPAAALITHHCDRFYGAITLWLGQTGKQLQADDYYYLQQVMVRGTAYMLKEKGQFTERAYDQLLQKMNRETKPNPLPENLEARFPSRPWGDTFLPKSQPPAPHMLTVDLDSLNPDQRIALATLQGLTSRSQPRLWLNITKDDTPFWLEWHRNKGHIESYEEVEDWKSLFTTFRDSFRGAVIPDDKMYRGELIAVNVASCEGLIVASPVLAAELNLPVKVDLRGRFQTYAEAMKWLWDRYGEQFNLHLCDSIHPIWLENCAFAYDVQWKSLVFWISGVKDGGLPGAEPLEETALMADIFTRMHANTAFLGFPWWGAGVGLGEVGGTSFLGGYGKSLVCTDNLSNLPVTSGVTIGPIKQKTQPPAPRLEKDKVYIAIVYSDGDNQNIWQEWMKNYFLDEAYGSFPVSFGLGPVMHDLQPAVAQWFYEHAHPTTEFISDVSGVGYMRPEDYGLRYANRDEVFDRFMDWTAKYLRKMDMRSLRTVGGADQSIKPYIQGIPFMHSVFADMGRYSGRSGYPNLTYTLNGMPIFRCQNTWSRGDAGVIDEVREQIADIRPAFVNVMAHLWSMKSPSNLKEKFVDKMDPDMVLVTPGQLALLYEQAKKAGWAK